VSWSGTEAKALIRSGGVGDEEQRLLCFPGHPHVCRLASLAGKYTLKRDWMWEGETLQSKSSFSEEQLCAFVCGANRPAKRKGTAFTREQSQSSSESFFLFIWRNFAASPKETFTFPLENRLLSPGEMVCEKARVGITSEMSIQSEPQMI